jgi:hypothetical protein
VTIASGFVPSLPLHFAKPEVGWQSMSPLYYYSKDTLKKYLHIDDPVGRSQREHKVDGRRVEGEDAMHAVDILQLTPTMKGLTAAHSLGIVTSCLCRSQHLQRRELTFDGR